LPSSDYLATPEDAVIFPEGPAHDLAPLWPHRMLEQSIIWDYRIRPTCISTAPLHFSVRKVGQALYVGPGGQGAWVAPLSPYLQTPLGSIYL